MIKLTFKDLDFEEKGDKIRVNFLKIFYFDIAKEELNKISGYKINKNSIMFSDIAEEKAGRKFDFILKKGFDNLRNSLNGNKAVYIHKNSGIPLIGSLAFGIVDKGSNMLEIKPITGCNLDCIFCSVDEGRSSKKKVDFVVEKGYIIEELEKLVSYKLGFDMSEIIPSNGISGLETTSTTRSGMISEHVKNQHIDGNNHKIYPPRQRVVFNENIEFDVYINPHGEPLLYADIVELINDISKLRNINVISIITNGVLLNKALVDKLTKAGLNQINLSLNAIDAAKSRKLAGNKSYKVENIADIAQYTANRIKLVISPVILPNINDKEMDKIVKFAKKLKAEVLIQKFLYNKKGRNPVKEQAWEDFYGRLREIEEKENIRLMKKGRVMKTKELVLPFKKGDVIKARVVCEGRYLNERIAVAKERAITVVNCLEDINKEIKVRILKSNHNVFIAEKL